MKKTATSDRLNPAHADDPPTGDTRPSPRVDPFSLFEPDTAINGHDNDLDRTKHGDSSISSESDGHQRQTDDQLEDDPLKFTDGIKSRSHN